MKQKLLTVLMLVILCGCQKPVGNTASNDAVEFIDFAADWLTTRELIVDNYINLGVYSSQDLEHGHVLYYVGTDDGGQIIHQRKYKTSPHDRNHDGIVNLEDFAVFAKEWKK
jgi:hypothetical protein